MKKLSVLLVAAIVVLALTMPAAAFENEFGGYWRTRAFTDIGFSGEDRVNSQDINAIDTRTRLFYTAKFSENLKFINKFELNAMWGKNKGYGQIGADNTDLNASNTFRVKNSYVDFKLAEQRFTVGIQNFQLARGYLFDDDASGVKAIFKVNDAVYLPLIYMKLYEGGYGRETGANSKSNSDFDVSAYVFYPTIYLNKDNTLKPHAAYLTTENYSKATSKDINLSAISLPGATKLDLWTLGLEYDGKIDIFEMGATGIFQFGDVTVPKALYGNHDKLNFKGYLFDIFGGVNLGPANIHAKGIYSSGNGKDDPSVSGDIKTFLTPGAKDNFGASYYWAEIMGDGLIDNQTPNGAPGDKISNVIIGNLGASYKVLPTLKFSADLWYAKTAEDVYLSSIKQYKGDLGTELDLVASYTIVDNLKIDLIGAYLWAGDVITKNSSATGSTNPIELATMLSLAF
ncbi:MAG: hypothetical protein V1844_20695 [Pseudomonadota bacterium]